MKPVLNRPTDPVATVGAIVIRPTCDSFEIVLIKRNTKPYKGFWALPGGHIERNETAEAAIYREVKEESGLTFTGSFYRYVDEIIPEEGIHAVVILFAGSATGSFKLQELEVTDVNWFPAQDVMQMPLAFQHKEMITQFISDYPNIRHRFQ
ncbi:NUDIX hydrolase [candidate division KSB1 bacterium]|nr:NUDIX hydrolase [candidate division KSB1 bacterium]